MSNARPKAKPPAMARPVRRGGALVPPAVAWLDSEGKQQVEAEEHPEGGERLQEQPAVEADDEGVAGEQRRREQPPTRPGDRAHDRVHEHRDPAGDEDVEHAESLDDVDRGAADSEHADHERLQVERQRTVQVERIVAEHETTVCGCARRDP